MSKLSRHKEKHGKHCEPSHLSEETAARTRPLSFDEIMRGRENKDLSERVKKENVEEESMGDGIPKKASDHYESERSHHRHPKKSLHGAPKLRSEVFVIGSSRNEEENPSGEEKPNKHKRRNHDSKTKVGAEREDRASHTKLRTKRECPASETKRRAQRETHASQTQMRVERGGHASENKMRDGKEGHASQTKTRNENESHALQAKMRAEMKKGTSTNASETTDKQIHSRQKIPDRMSNVLENETDRNRLRSLIVMDGPRDGSNRKPDKDERKYQNGDNQRNRDRKTLKKHDLEKMHNVEIAQREEKKEHPKLQDHDMSEKRRRSRSRDLTQDRDRRYSFLPRAHKATYRQPEHEELSQERFGRHRSDYDRNRNTKNDSNSHSKRRNESGNGLGGYSPRKRRAKALVKTPSPPSRSPEKKVVKWDIASTGTCKLISESVLPNFQSAMQIASTTSNEAALAVLNPLTGIPFSTPPAKQIASIDSVHLTESTRPLRRLYVENVPDSLSDKSLMECFNNYLISSGFNHIQGNKPCISCVLHKENGLALVEFLTPEDASSALAFDGCSFAGSILKIRRPKDFVEVTTGELEKTEAAKEALSNIVKDSSNKIFVGGISKDYSSEMLMEIVSVFGALKAYRYEINEDLDEPCVFLEYSDQSVTLKACAALNGMKLGGNVITAVQAFPDASFLANGENPPYYAVPEHAKPLLRKPSHVLKLKNVFDPDGLPSLSEPKAEEILEDVRLECARFGAVKSINLVKHQPSYMTNNSKAYAAENPKSADSDEIMAQRDASESSSHPYKETNLLEAQQRNKESEKADNTMDSDNSTDERPAVETAEDLVHECKDEATFEERINVSIALRLEPNESTKAVSIENQTAKTELNSGDVLVKSQEDIVGAVGDEDTRQLGSVEKVEIDEDESSIDHVFEPGSIFVEYGRIESSCMAAHSLHGRLFDNRIVTVEYVPLNIYRQGFPNCAYR